jgi:sugar O-acyltransferase (sialic acid O-acetyltransferase NeuD family)
MPLYLVGAGGVGRETLDMALAAGVPVTAFLDDRLAGQRIRERPVLAPAEAPKGAHFAVAIAESHARRSLSARLEGLGLTPMSLVHPRAVVAPVSVLGGGNLVQANSFVSSSVHTGAHCQIHYNATVGHDTVLDDFVSVFPGANVAGSVRLGAGSTIGSNAVVLQGITVGAGAFVGAGAVVTRDVDPGCVVTGAPARPLVTGTRRAWT